MYTNATKEAKKIKIYFEDTITGQDQFALKFFAWATIIEIKKELEKIVKTSHHNMRLCYKNIELTKNGRRLLDYGVKNRDVFVIKMTPKLEDSLGILNPYMLFEQTPQSIIDLLENVKTGFLKNIKPRLADNGTSGSYILENHVRKPIGIFKPFDEEPYAPNNPRGFIGKLGSPGFRSGVLSGESATRQVAAYMINDEFHDVPPTTYVEFYHPSFEQRNYSEGPIRSQTAFTLTNQSKTKHGSLQGFVAHDDIAGNYGSNLFSVQEVHKIAILDIRILNCDRNQQNILVKKSAVYVETSTGQKLKKEYKLLPIDHGLSFPDNFAIYDYEIVWMDYNQSRQPFTEKELAFIRSIDPIKDVQKLRQKLGFREICLRNFRIAETLLKEAAATGFNLAEIGHMLYRKEEESVDSDDEEAQRRARLSKFSEVEKIVGEAQNIYFFVKQNGIKSTIEYQIGLIKPRDKLFEARTPNMLPIHEEQDSDEEASHPDRLTKKNSAATTKQTNKRSVSLPGKRNKQHTSHKNSHIQKRQSKKLISQESSTNIHSSAKLMGRELRIAEEKWEEIFFHYFEDILRRFLKDKKSKMVKRDRIRSVCVDSEDMML